VLKAEEERFFQTIANGMEILEGALAGGHQMIDGETAFKLHDTFGFPLDLTADVCRERGVTVDEAGFDAAMNRQREQARAAPSSRWPPAWSTTARPPPSTATSTWCANTAR
jgi:alanyl-tRNA synthetase